MEPPPRSKSQQFAQANKLHINTTQQQNIQELEKLINTCRKESEDAFKYMFSNIARNAGNERIKRAQDVFEVFFENLNKLKKIEDLLKKDETKKTEDWKKDFINLLKCKKEIASWFWETKKVYCKGLYFTCVYEYDQLTMAYGVHTNLQYDSAEKIYKSYQQFLILCEKCIKQLDDIIKPKIVRGIDSDQEIKNDVTLVRDEQEKEIVFLSERVLRSHASLYKEQPEYAKIADKMYEKALEEKESKQKKVEKNNESNGMVVLDIEKAFKEKTFFDDGGWDIIEENK